MIHLDHHASVGAIENLDAHAAQMYLFRTPFANGDD
jgi:hypothetical protein